MKKIIKKFIGLLKCMISGIQYNKNTYIGRNVHIVNGRNIKLGKNVSIRPNCDLFASQHLIQIGNNCDIGTRNRIVGNVVIEDSVLIGPDNYICSCDHVYQNIEIPIMNQGTYDCNANGHSSLIIGEGSWIGTHCAIIGDVHIGIHCVVGANSVVTRDIPDYSVALGAPAKVLKRYDKITEKWEKID